MGIWMFCHYDVKMTSYIKIFYEFEFKTLKIAPYAKFELHQVIILKIIQASSFFNPKNDVTHWKQKVAMATSYYNGY